MRDLDFSLQILFHKGDKKSDVDSRLIKEEVQELIHQIEEIIGQIEAKLDQFKAELETPFVPKSTRDIALEGVEKQLRDMKVRRKDCDRLTDLIG